MSDPLNCNHSYLPEQVPTPEVEFCEYCGMANMIKNPVSYSDLSSQNEKMRKAIETTIKQFENPWGTSCKELSQLLREALE